MLEEILNSLPLWLPGVIVMVLLTLVSGFFSGSETALFSLTRTDMQAFRSGTAQEKRVLDLLAEPSRLLTAILFWNLVINLSFFAVSVVIARRMMINGYETVGWGISFLGVVFIILFGEVIPKSLAVVFAKPCARLAVWPLLISVRLLDRVLPALSIVARGLQRGFWPSLVEETVLDAEDLEKAVDLSSQSSEMMANERNILHHILDLSEITVEEVMRPRGTYIAVAEPVSWKDLRQINHLGDFAAIVESGTDQVYSVYWMPGTVYNSRKGLESFRESVVFLPWCAHAARALNLMRSRFCHTAVIVDEYGHTIGMLTQEDILETILSTSPSRARRILQREAVLRIGEDCYHLDSVTTLRYLAQHLNIAFAADDESSVTVTGLLQQELRRFPELGDEIVWQGWRMRVIEVNGPGRTRLMMEPDTAKPATEETAQ